MEEIICPQCERPNLMEAKKCWYCQTHLENTQANIDNNSTDDIAKNNKYQNKQSKTDFSETEQDIPDWLKRVRSLKEADNPPEEEDPNWEQQDLFKGKNSGNEQKKKIKKTSKAKSSISKSSKKRIDRTQQTDKKKTDEQSTIENDVQDLLKPNNEPIKNDDIDDLSKELPEGFTEL